MMRLGPPGSECRILTFREGLLSSFGHDLEIVVTRFDVRVDPDARRVDASFDAASLRVARALRDGIESALSDADRRTIEDAIRRDVLDRYRGRLGPLSPAQEEALEGLTKGIINKIAHGPISEIRRQAAEHTSGDAHHGELIHAVRRIFRLGER